MSFYYINRLTLKSTLDSPLLDGIIAKDGHQFPNPSPLLLREVRNIMQPTLLDIQVDNEFPGKNCTGKTGLPWVALGLQPL